MVLRTAAAFGGKIQIRTGTETRGVKDEEVHLEIEVRGIAFDFLCFCRQCATLFLIEIGIVDEPDIEVAGFRERDRPGAAHQIQALDQRSLRGQRG